MFYVFFFFLQFFRLVYLTLLSGRTGGDGHTSWLRSPRLGQDQPPALGAAPQCGARLPDLIFPV